MGQKHINKFMEEEKKKDGDNPDKLKQRFNESDHGSISEKDFILSEQYDDNESYISLIKIPDFKKGLNLKEYLEVHSDFLKGKMMGDGLDFQISKPNGDTKKKGGTSRSKSAYDLK